MPKQNSYVEKKKGKTCKEGRWCSSFLDASTLHALNHCKTKVGVTFIETVICTYICLFSLFLFWLLYLFNVFITCTTHFYTRMQKPTILHLKDKKKQLKICKHPNDKPLNHCFRRVLFSSIGQVSVLNQPCRKVFQNCYQVVSRRAVRSDFYGKITGVLFKHEAYM